MQPSSLLDNIAQQPEFLSAVSRNNIEYLYSTRGVKYLSVGCLVIKLESLSFAG